MAFQAIPGGFYLPHPYRESSETFLSLFLDTAGDSAAGIMRAPKTGTITKVGFRTGTVTTGDTVDVRLETVSLTTGDPTGTLLGANSNGAQVIGSGDDNTWFTTTLTTGVAVTKGDLLAAVIVNGSVPGVLNINNHRAVNNCFPYSDLFVSAAWTKQPAEAPVFSLEYTGGSYGVSPGVFPFSNTAVSSFSNASTPDERGLKFKLPFPARITGATVWVDLDGDADLVLYNAADSVLETVSLDKDVRAVNSRTNFYVPFDGTQELVKDTFYRLVVKPTSATALLVFAFDVDAVAIMDSFDGGQDFHHTERTDAGAWTDTTTKRPFICLHVDGFDDAVGGGAASILGHVGLHGGFAT